MNIWKLTVWWLIGAVLLHAVVWGYYYNFVDTEVISEAKGSIKDNNPYLIGQSEDGLVLLYKYDRCYVVVHGMSNGIGMSCKY